MTGGGPPVGEQGLLARELLGLQGAGGQVDADVAIRGRIIDHAVTDQADQGHHLAERLKLDTHSHQMFKKALLHIHQAYSTRNRFICT